MPLLKQDGDTLANTIHPVLQKLCGDTDVDVRFYATRALESEDNMNDDDDAMASAGSKL